MNVFTGRWRPFLSEAAAFLKQHGLPEKIAEKIREKSK
jgi:hypothetical protein